MLYLLVFIVALAAFAVSAVSGGGAGLILLPLLGLVVPATQVPAALSLGTATSALSRGFVFRTHIRWDLVRWFVPAAIPATGLGAWLLTLVQPTWVEFLLGLFLAVNIVAVFRAGAEPGGVPLPRPLLLAVGAAAGLLSGFTGAVGVVFNRFYLRCGMSKEEVVATRSANEILLHVIKIGLYGAFGLIGAAALKAGALVALAAILASIMARPLVASVSEPLFRRVNHAAMGIAGVAMLAVSANALAAQYGLGVHGRFEDGGFEAGINLRERAVSLEWKPGHAPQIERTIAVASVPADVREEAEDMREAGGIGPVRIEEVHDIHGLSYEIHVGSLKRSLVVTD